MAQQTAVEYFHEKTWELKMLLEKQQISVDEYGVAYYDILEESKEMEKQQIIDESKITRLEIINHAENTLQTGRLLVLYQELGSFKSISMSVQDDGKTLKIFLE